MSVTVNNSLPTNLVIEANGQRVELAGKLAGYIGTPCQNLDLLPPGVTTGVDGDVYSAWAAAHPELAGVVTAS
jgi:hypothetical protein